MDGQALVGIGLIAVPVFLSLTLHEYGHARTAQAFGDHTARLMGRCTLNPLAHLDILGTLCFLFGPFGWAKPVPVNPANMHPRRKGEIAVSLAGVGMNLLLVVLATVGLHAMAAGGVTIDTAPDAAPTPAGVAAFMMSYAIVVNIVLTIFNLIPLYPLDGHHVVRELLPAHSRAPFMDFQRRYGRYALLGLLVAPWLIRQMGRDAPDPIGALLGAVIWPVLQWLLPGDAIVLTGSAWQRYGPYLPW